MVTPFAAAMSYARAQAGRRSLPRDLRKIRQYVGTAHVQLFHALRDSKVEEDAQRARQIRYYKECVIPAFPGDPKTAPPSYRYFIDIVERLRNVKPEDLTRNSVLLGSSTASPIPSRRVKRRLR